jgi:hypothetical protein
MVRMLVLLVGLILVVSASARAQGLGDKIEVFGGYSYVRFKTSPGVNLNGWEVAGQYKITPWLGAVADLDGQYGRVGGSSSQVYTYLFGPQVSWPSRLSPFVHVLGGGARFSGGQYTSKSFSFDIGAGVDTRIRKRLFWRIIQIDYLPTHLGGRTQDSDRLSTGIVIRF